VRVLRLQRPQDGKRLGIQPQAEQARRRDLPGHHDVPDPADLHRFQQGPELAQMDPDHLVGISRDALSVSPLKANATTRFTPCACADRTNCSG
jgi:hypothetical protein